MPSSGRRGCRSSTRARGAEGSGKETEGRTQLGAQRDVVLRWVWKKRNSEGSERRQVRWWIGRCHRQVSNDSGHQPDARRRARAARRWMKTHHMCAHANRQPQPGTKERRAGRRSTGKRGRPGRLLYWTQQAGGTEGCGQVWQGRAGQTRAEQRTGRLHRPAGGWGNRLPDRRSVAR